MIDLLLWTSNSRTQVHGGQANRDSYFYTLNDKSRYTYKLYWRDYSVGFRVVAVWGL